MDFVASQYNKTIPSKSTFSPSDHQLEYKDGETIRFEIPAFNAFIDPRQTYLTFKVRVDNAPAVVTFSKKCGIHSLISQVRVYDMNSNLQLETIQNYAELAEKLHFYSENRTVRNKRGLTELLEPSSRDFDGVLYDDFPSRNGDKSMLFNSYTTGRQASYDYSVATTENPNTCEVAVQLYSGILGALSQKMMPAGLLTKGLRVEIDLNSAKKSLELWSGAGICNNDGSVASDIIESCRFGIQSALPNAANPVTSIDLYMEKNPGFNQIVAAAAGAGQRPTQAAIGREVLPVRNQACGALNLLVGKTVRGFTNANPPVLKDIGRITSVEVNAGENGGGIARVRLNLAAAAGANGNEFIGGAGRDAAGAAQDADNNSCFISKDTMFNTTPQVVLTDCKFVLKTAQPPAGYVEQLAKSTMTEEGAVHDYLTYSCYRNNTTAAEQTVQLNMPVINQMATSVLTLCTENGLSEEVYHDNLGTIVDNADNYNYLVNNKLQPTRKVELGKLSNAVPLTEQVALWETEKALGSARCMVRNLEAQEGNFLIGRALAKYGGVYNLQADGNLGLRVEYSTSNPPQKNKLWINQIASIRRLVVNRDGASVIY